MTFGLGAALIERMVIKDGVMQATNFDTYPVLRMSDVPPMDVAVISTNDPPTGIGEAGVPAVAPAIASAVATADRETTAAPSHDAGSGEAVARLSRHLPPDKRCRREVLSRRFFYGEGRVGRR